MNKSFMIAVRTTITVETLIEVVAESVTDAKRQVREMEGGLDALKTSSMEYFMESAREQVEYVDPSDLKIVSLGRADQYHDKSECDVCSSVA